MADIPSSIATTQTIAIGGSVSDSLEVAGDHDWFRISLTAGQPVSVTLEGISLTDPFLTIRDSNGNILLQNDDGGPGLSSLLAFSPTYTGTYYIDVGAAQDTGDGTYQLTVQPYVQPPLGTIDQFAQWMATGFWNGDTHHFAVAEGGIITVNLDALTAEGQNLARVALDLWTDVVGVTFSQVSGDAQIMFDDLENGTGAFSTGVWSDGITTSATVNVSPSRLGSGTGIARSGLQTYIHEIGHALGLGHAGDYNGGTAFSRYPYEATYVNDGAAISVMSYFDNGENSYYAAQGFTNALVATPQIADIAAVQLLYGLSTTTRTGNTVYGFGNSSGREVFDAALHPGFAYTIVDSGGTDTLDYSGFGNPQLINLNPETFSNVGFSVGNVSIARGTIIENAVGGSGADTIIGNGANNVITGNGGADILTGGAGSDQFRDSAAGLNHDTITDLGRGDGVVITDANLAGFTFNLSGHTLTFSGGSLTLTNVPTGRIVAQTAAGGGVQLAVLDHAAHNDFNGDGGSDVLWLHDNGTVRDWLGQANGTFAGNIANVNFLSAAGSHVAGTGDFNGDGSVDVLWQTFDGVVVDLLGNFDGFIDNSAKVNIRTGTDWQVIGTADFNGDGRDDVLLQHSNGTVREWLGQADGTFAGNIANVNFLAAAGSKAVGTGDFNGDGYADTLWQTSDGLVTDLLGTASGGFIDNYAKVAIRTGVEWHAIGTGDFNGDGRDDILWKNDNGTIREWLGQADGTFTGNIDHVNFLAGAGSHLVAVGDFNGDGFADILSQTSDGLVTDLLGTASGGFVDNYTKVAIYTGTSWHAQDPFVHDLLA